MQGEKDNEIIRVGTDRYDIAVLADIGDRDEQQDNFGFELGGEGALITVCDGMGGYRGGRIASRLAVRTILEAYGQQTDGGDPIAFLQQATKSADRAVSRLPGINGKPFEGGCTMITLLVSPDLEETLVSVLFRVTSTLGIRRSILDRYVLDRREETLETEAGKVRCKISSGYGVSRRKFEYDDIAAIAKAEGKSIREIRERIEGSTVR